VNCNFVLIQLVWTKIQENKPGATDVKRAIAFAIRNPAS